MKEEKIKENGNKHHANSDPTASEQVFADMDEAIRLILWKVHKKWGGDHETRQEEVKDDIQETVALSPNGLKKRPVPLPSLQQDEALPETIILSPSGQRSNGLSAPKRQQMDTPESLEETHILRDRGKPGLLKKEGKKPPGHDFLTETVLLKSGKKKDPNKDDK
jgi:hypothetical protein